MNAGDIIAGRYTLAALIGEGGFGVVWRATHLETGRDVALKFLKGADPKIRRRFAVEARALGRLRHRNCVIVDDSGTTDDGMPYLVLELIDGEPLSTKRGVPLPISEVVSIAVQLADVLAVAHREGIVHRDLKPENVLLVRDGDDVVVKVVDFGIAKVTSPELPDITKTGELLGTPHYMSPEQLRGSRDVGPATDQYALGVMLYELLEGQLPFDGADLLAIGMAHLGTPAPNVRRADCPAYLRETVARLLAKDPRERFGDTRMLLDCLRTSTSPRAALPTVVEYEGRPPARPYWHYLFVAVPLIVVAVGLMLARSDPPPNRSLPPQVTRASAPTRTLPPPAPPVTDTEAKSETSPAPLTESGCGRSIRERGLNWSELDAVARFVPESYDANRRYPLIVVLRGGNEDPFKFLGKSGLIELAERDGAIIVAPDELDDHYFREAIVENTLFWVDVSFQDYCIDPERIFVIGQNHGSVAATRLGCQPWVRATAMHAYRLSVRDAPPKCPGRVAPSLVMWPMKSKLHPLEGGRGPERCEHAPGSETRPLDQMQGFQSDRHECHGEPTRSSLGGGACTERTCKSRYVSCELQGGIIWPGTPGRRANKSVDIGAQRRMDECDGQHADFPATQTVWEFFGLHDESARR